MAPLAPARRRERTLTVQSPWAWCWWPTSRPLVNEDPDVVDQREPRPISQAEVDWGLIVNAVCYAVSSCPPPPQSLHLEHWDVEVPYELSDTEYRIARAWVGRVSPVTYWYESDLVQDGRHRLWLSRGKANRDAVPVLSTNLYYFQEAVADPTQAQVLVEEVLPEAARWWEGVDAELQDHNRRHREVLAHAYLEVSAPAPLPESWFRLLAPWDKHLDTLAWLQREGRVDVPLLRAALPQAWRFRQDHTEVTREQSLGLFRDLHAGLGFTIMGQPSLRPRGTLTLYRGATQENRCGLSWSVEPSEARYFAHARQAPGARASVWTVRVPAARCLMAVPHEKELIVDLDGLEHLVHPASPEARTDRWTRAQFAWLTRR